MTGVPGSSLQGARAAQMLISPLEFDVLWEHLRLGEQPLVLRVPSPGRTHTERAALVDEVWRGLQQRGLAESRSVRPRLAGLLTLLAHPELELDGRFWLGRRTGSVRLLAAAANGAGALATLSGVGLVLREIAPSGLVREGLGVLPPGPAGPGGSVTLPSDWIDQAAASSADVAVFEANLIRHGARRQDAHRLHEMIKHARRQGQFGAAARDRWGKRVRAPRVVGFFDSNTGRYLQMRRESPDGRLWTTIAPADHRTLQAHLTTLLDETESPR